MIDIKGKIVWRSNLPDLRSPDVVLSLAAGFNPLSYVLLINDLARSSSVPGQRKTTRCMIFPDVFKEIGILTLRQMPRTRPERTVEVVNDEINGIRQHADAHSKDVVQQGVPDADKERKNNHYNVGEDEGIF